MRTRAEVWAEMLDVVADARAAATEDDSVSVEIDHHRLDELITEIQQIPQQRTGS